MNQDTRSPSPTSALPRMGRYQLLGKLGQGGMGEVFLARDTELDRSVALKVLPPESVHDPDAVARFQREARALAKLSHPGIVQAHDSGSDGGRHFLVMEYVEGKSLATVLKEAGRVSPARAADYIHQASLALQHAHEKDLVHRDLKPSNLLLTPQGRVKLLDLGLARFLQDQIADPNRTREGVGMGTPDYAAPEQFRDARHADARSDLYALGCTLYHLLSGRVPFPGSSLRAKWEAHEKTEPQPLEELCPEAPAGLVLAVQKMMSKRPAERFASAADAAEALAPFVAGSSESLRHLRTTRTWSRGQLTSPQLPRRAWLWASLTVATILLMGLSFGLAWLLRGPSAVSGPSPLASKVGDAHGKAPDDPNVLTVAKNGEGKFQNITEALAKVGPGQTIRVLDDAVYEEAPLLRGAAQLANITLESPRHATIVPDGKGFNIDGSIAKSKLGLAIIDVPGVTVRGFRFRSSGPYSLVYAEGACPGLVLDQLQLEPETTAFSHGILIQSVSLKGDDRPVLIQDCQFHGGKWAIEVKGQPEKPGRKVLIRNNLISVPEIGALLYGRLEEVQLVGNRFQGSILNAVSLSRFDDRTRDLLLANNTFLDCRSALVVFDTKFRGTNILVRNNLILGVTEPDMYHLKWNGWDGIWMKAEPGDGRLLPETWRIENNWREVKVPAAGSKEATAWILPTKDERRDRIEVLSRDSRSPDFLRPAADSPLATQGANKDDSSLPPYVGAVPPHGTPAWDWDHKGRERATGKDATK